MVSIKLLIVACTLVVAQTQAYPQTTVNGPILDLIKKLVPVGEKLIDAALVKLDDIVNAAISDSDKFQQDVVNVADKSLDKTLDLLNALLDKIKARGDEKTVKVFNCIENSKEQAKKVALDFIDRTTKCEVPLAKEVLQSVADLSPKIQDMKSELYAAVDQIQQCDGSNFNDEIKCGVDIINDIVGIISKNKDNVIKDLLGLISKVLDLAKQVHPKCVVPNWKQFEEERFVLINSISACMIS